MEELLRELEASFALLEQLRARLSVCFPCKWILEDLGKNGKLTGYPKDYNGSSSYPLSGKLLHLYLELVGGVPEHIDDGMEALPAVVRRLRQMVVKN